MKTIAIVATGGTIAGVGEVGKAASYVAGELAVSDVLKTIPMIKNIAEDLDILENQVNIKATTEEKLGFTGEGLGMSCHAVCLLENA